MKKLFRQVSVLLISACLLPLMANANESAATTEFTLDNGLKVIVREDHRAPVVVSQLWYKVGSSYETPGSTGLAHALEHMMFKGSSKLGPGESSLILRDIGAQENAFTSSDYTAYYQVLSSDRLEIALELEADRLAGLTLPEDEFLREIEVIKEERRMRTDDRPTSLAYERFQAMVYPSSSYSIPTIGWMHDLNRMTINDLRQWHEQWYAPNNATLVIVGDVQPEQVKTLVQRHFGPIKARPIPDAKRPIELDQPGERRLTLYLNSQVASLMMGFNVPSLNTLEDPKQIHALRLLSAVLSSGPSARLATNLERKQELVVGAYAWYDAHTRGSSMFALGATPNVQNGITLEQVEAGFWKEIDKLKTTPPSQAELDRVRAQVIASQVYERDSIEAQATAIGQLETVGLSWRLLDEDVKALEQVTPADISKAARTYLTKSRLSVVHLYPQEARP
ncbi:pitrilysin family protein [Pseudomonas sp. F1_0610]|uniref:M16 family metallopeptidase n=1 Tax=Pseudomonas sp. F1_0610 TaxID=3114284 RepID=UPI0039C052B2